MSGGTAHVNRPTKPRKKPVKGGRPTDFRPEFTKLAKNYAQLGATIPEIGEFLGVCERTVYRWAAQHRKFSQAIRVGKEPADDRTIQSLYHRANGYSHPAEEIFLVDVTSTKTDKDGNVVTTVTKEALRVPTRKHYPPETLAISLWLRNRDPKNWRDKSELDVNVLTTAEQLREARERAQSRT